MTSTKSAYKSNFAPILIKTFKERLVNIIAILFVAIFTPIVAIAFEVLMGYSNGETDVTYNVIAILAFMVIACGFFSLSIAVKMFKEIYKKRSCDLFFSLPVKRGDYFFAKYTLGAIVNIAAFTLAGTIYTVIIPMLSTHNVTYIIDYPMLIKVAITLLLSLISIYTAFIMCAVITGKRIHYIFLALICLLCTHTAVSGIIAALNSIWGLYINPYIFNTISPVQNAISAVVSSSNLGALCAISIVETIGMLIAGYIAFKRRKAEVAEFTLSGKVLPFVLLSVLICSGFMYYSALGNLFGSVVIGILFAVLFAMAFSGIFYKKVFTEQTGITTIAVCLVCTIFLSAVYIPNHTRYVKNIPDASEVESVEFKEVSTGDYGIGLLGLVANSFATVDDGISFTVKNEQGIEDIIKLHEKLVNDNTIEKSKHTGTLTLFEMIVSADYSSYSNGYECQLIYKLKNGTTEKRTYSVDSTLVLDEMADVFRNAEVLDQMTPFNIPSDSILYSTADATIYNDYYESEDTYTEDTYTEDTNTIQHESIIIDTEEFLKCYQKDLIETKDAATLINELPIDLYAESSNEYYYEEAATVSICYIRDDVSDEVREELKSKSVQELEDLKHSYDIKDEYLYDALCYKEVFVEDYQQASAGYLRNAGLTSIMIRVS